MWAIMVIHSKFYLVSFTLATYLSLCRNFQTCENVLQLLSSDSPTFDAPSKCDILQSVCSRYLKYLLLIVSNSFLVVLVYIKPDLPHVLSTSFIGKTLSWSIEIVCLFISDKVSCIVCYRIIIYCKELVEALLFPMLNFNTLLGSWKEWLIITIRRPVFFHTPKYLYK